ncbi:hypothetical protein SELMODRAFT_420686 [Selaginella moellendorffii]|uniref:Uncharacterized protein n=1 Tax=Selaginella moellendorffii TaxID=88036 RepID=D8SCT1_SELML|nr:hypothetical protein SELMODRAFT_420686 [Selaginella moellendorffii]
MAKKVALMMKLMLLLVLAFAAFGPATARVDLPTVTTMTKGTARVHPNAPECPKKCYYRRRQCQDFLERAVLDKVLTTMIYDLEHHKKICERECNYVEVFGA